MVIVVPFPRTVSIFISSVNRFIFGRPIPAPNPSERTSGRAVAAFLHGLIDIRDAGPAVGQHHRDGVVGYGDGDGAAVGMDHHIDLALVHGDRGLPDRGAVHAQHFQTVLHGAAGLPGAGEVAAVDVISINKRFSHAQAPPRSPFSYRMPQVVNM